MTKAEIEFQDFTEQELDEARQAAVQGNAGPLKVLCRKEVARFEDLMKRHPDYVDGLVQIERFAVEGYIYQKLRGHVDASSPVHSNSEEG